MVGIIRFKYGFESMVINSNPEFVDLKRIIESFSLNSDDTINQYNYILTMYNNIVSKIKSMDFIDNKYINKDTKKEIQGKEGLYIAVESLKSLITNNKYRQLLNSKQISEILIDCFKLNNGFERIEKLELKYKDIIKKYGKTYYQIKLMKMETLEFSFQIFLMILI